MKAILSNDLQTAKALSSKHTKKIKRQRKTLLSLKDMRANNLRKRLSRKTERRRSKMVPNAGSQLQRMSVIKKTIQRKRKLATDDNVQVAKRKRKSNILYQSKPFTKKNLKKIAFSNKPSTNVSSLSDIGELKESCSFFGAFKLKKSILSFVAAKEGLNFPS